MRQGGGGGGVLKKYKNEVTSWNKFIFALSHNYSKHQMHKHI
jgi:hypothetical protein